LITFVFLLALSFRENCFDSDSAIFQITYADIKLVLLERFARHAKFRGSERFGQTFHRQSTVGHVLGFFIPRCLCRRGRSGKVAIILVYPVCITNIIYYTKKIISCQNLS